MTPSQSKRRAKRGSEVLEAEARREAPRVAAADNDRRAVLLLPLGRAQGVAAERTEARHCIFFFFRIFIITHYRNYPMSSMMILLLI